MEKLGLMLFLLGNMLVLAVEAREILVTSSECSNFYDMNDIGEDVFLTYSGIRLNNQECHVQFQNYRTFEKQICVKPEKINLSCSTKVDYYRGFISKYLDPVKQFSCDKRSFDEWCGPTRTNRLYIVFRTSGSSSSQDIRLHIYLKYLPGHPEKYDSDYSSSSSGGIIAGVVIGVLFLFGTMAAIIACKVAQQRRQAIPRTPYVVQTTAAVPSNQPGYQSTPQPSYQPPPQAPFQPGLQGNYQLHPMQSAYPSAGQQYPGVGQPTSYHPVPMPDTRQHSPVSFQHPSAPTVDNTELPPSYESVTK